jgi:hypothetical protein
MVEMSISSNSDEKSKFHGPKQEFYDESSSNFENERNSALTKDLINKSSSSKTLEDDQKSPELAENCIKEDDSYSDEEKPTD